MIDWQAFLSAENFAQAWAKVRSNNGCAGSDGETIDQFDRHADRNLAQLRHAMQRGTYQPLPLRSFAIPKKSKPKPGEVPKPEWRWLAVPTVRDRIVQQALLNLLHPLLEPQFEDCSFAYRPGRSYKAAVRQVDQWRQQGYDWVLDADVVKYFDNVQHSRLYAELQERAHDPNVGELVEKWLSSGVITAAGLVLPPKGLPQGAVVSPILANVYLDDFDEAIEDAGLKLVRFADDFVILSKTEQRIEQAQELVDRLLQSMGLELHPDKTRVTNFHQGFHFLGHTFVNSLIVEDQHKTKAQRQQTPPAGLEPLPLRVEYADPPAQVTQMQQALLAAVQGSKAPIPPPLYVVMGYKVREAESKVEIKSKEFEWRDGMSTLYLVKQGMALRKEQGRFWVKAGSEGQNEREVEVPIREVEQVLVFGNVQLSTAVIGACLEAQIPVVFLSQLGDYKGHLWSAEFCDLKLQARQFRLFEDSAFQEKMTRQLVQGKLWNCKQLLLKLRRSRDLPILGEAIAGIDRDWQAVATAPVGVDLNVLRGYEGSAATRYFPAMGQLITNPGFSLTGRSRRPPKDPVNSLLSFGYTLLFNNVMSVILAEGLNPYLGNLHRSDRNEPHLAFDLMEEWRSPIVDSLVIRLVNQKVLRPTDFTFPNAEGGVYLEGAARRVFLKHFEERLSTLVSHPDVGNQVSYRRAIQLQVQRYKRAMINNLLYEPFRRMT